LENTGQPGPKQEVGLGSIEGQPRLRIEQRGEAMPDSVEAFLSNFPEEIQTISRELRAIARRAMPVAHEFLYYDAINYSLSNSPLERICYIRPLQKRVTLGFLFGRKLDDPHYLLRGTGKRMRHVKVRTMEDTRNPALEELVKTAWASGADAGAQMKRQMSRRTKHRRLRMRKRAAPSHRRTKRARHPRRKRR